MAFTYKSIGTSTAAVLSALAVGTLLWWQRPPAPVEIPRPQDEAEIMTACLERNYSMSRTNNFTNAYAANVSTIITNVDTSGTVVMLSATLHSGANDYINFYFSSLFSVFTHDKVVTLTGAGNPKSAIVIGTPVFFTLRHYTNAYWRTDADGSFTDKYFWRSSGDSLPATLLPYHYVSTFSYTSAAAVAADTSVRGVLTVAPRLLYRTVTNSPAHVDTNTIGLYPNATLNYPAAIRTAIASRTTTETMIPGDYGLAGRRWAMYPQGGQLPLEYNSIKVFSGRHWMVPSNTYMTTGEWTLSPSDASGTQSSMDTDASWWTNWVTKPTGSWTSTTNYPVYGSVVWFTNRNVIPWTTNWMTNTTYVSSNYLNIVTNGVGAGKLFAFERDRKPLYWSTNAYNDLARPLSMMQWQRSSVTIETTSFSIVAVRADDYPYWEMRMGNDIYWLPPCPPVCAWVSGSSWQGFLYVSLVVVMHQLRVTNDSPFLWTNAFFSMEYTLDTNYQANVSSDMMPNGRPMPAGEGDKTFTYTNAEWSLEPGQTKTSQYFCADMLLNASDGTFTGIVGAAINTLSNWLEFCVDRGAPFDNMFSNTVDNLQLPQFAVHSVSPACSYRVQFSALTNYLNHAPAR